MSMTTKLRVSFDATIVTTDKEFGQLVKLVNTDKADNVGGQKVLDHMKALLANYESAVTFGDAEEVRARKDALVEFAYKTVWRKAIRALLVNEAGDMGARFSPVKVDVI